MLNACMAVRTKNIPSILVDLDNIFDFFCTNNKAENVHMCYFLYCSSIFLQLLHTTKAHFLLHRIKVD